MIFKPIPIWVNGWVIGWLGWREIEWEFRWQAWKEIDLDIWFESDLNVGYTDG